MANITHVFEKYSVTPKHNSATTAKYKSLTPGVEMKVSHENFDYEKGEKLATQRMHESVANDFNQHSHNSKERWYKVEGTKIDSEAKPAEPIVDPSKN